MIPDKLKGISKLGFLGENRSVNRINDLTVFMQQRPAVPEEKVRELEASLIAEQGSPAVWIP